MNRTHDVSEPSCDIEEECVDLFSGNRQHQKESRGDQMMPILIMTLKDDSPREGAALGGGTELPPLWLMSPDLEKVRSVPEAVELTFV